MKNLVDTESTIKANKRIMEDLIKIQLLRKERERINEQEEKIKRHLALLLQDATLIVDGNGDELATWRAVEFNRFDKDSLKERFPDIYRSFIRKSFERRLYIYLDRRS